MEKTFKVGSASSSRTLIASAVVLFSSLLVARFTYFQAFLITPAILALLLCTATYLVTSALVRLDSRLSKPSGNAIRPLVFTTPSAWSAVLTRDEWKQKSTVQGPQILSTAPVAIRAALEHLMDLIQRHFILPWYSRISPSPAFPRGVDLLIRHAIANIIDKGNHVDWPSLLVSRLVPIIKDHLQHYRTVESITRTALPLPLPTQSHPALSSQDHYSSTGVPPRIEAHLRAQTVLVLAHILPEADKSEVVSLLVREILLGAVLLPVFEMLCEPDFWNRQIDEQGERYLLEQRKLDKFLTSLSTISDNRSSTITPVKLKAKARSSTASISAESSSQEFDTFLGSIAHVNALGEARRLRADVEREKRLAQIALEAEEQRATSDAIGKEGERWVKKAKKYVQRLARASMQLDTRISALSGLGKSPDLRRSPQTILQTLPPPLEISLQRVLQDHSSLAYWLEFMERRGRSKLVQFWLTVDGFRDSDPLETIESSPVEGFDLTTMDSSDMLSDATNLYKTYFAGGVEMGVSSRDTGVIQDFIKATPPMTTRSVRLVRRSIFAAQDAVFDKMAEEDWEEFKRSELYRKAVHDLSRQDHQSSRDTSTFSPRSVTSPVFAPSLPAKPLRHVSSPLLAKRPVGPTLVNGGITPTTVTPSASISTSPPTFSRSLTQIRSLTPSNQVTRPSTPPRRSHLDILFTGGLNSPNAEDDRRIFNEADEADEEFVQVQTMDAIQAALNDLIADDMNGPRKETISPPDSTIPSMSNSLVLSSTQASSPGGRLVSRSVEDLRSPSRPRPPMNRPPSHRSVDPSVARRRSMSKLTPASERERLFDDSIDEIEGEESFRESSEPEYVQLAAAGNLHLSPEISRLKLRIQELLNQQDLLEGYSRRAELEGEDGHAKWLQKSLSKVKRDLNSSIFQKGQYERQDEENRIVPGRTQISVPSAHVATDAAEGKQVAKYAIRVGQHGQDGQVGVNWVVYRRYNQFFELDRAIRDWAAQSGNMGLGREIKDLVELPGKKLLPSTSSGLVEARRHGLERYLKSLITSASLCDSDILRNFLSRSPPPIPISSVDEAGSSMLDSIHSTFNRQLNDVADGLGEVAEMGGDLIGKGLAAFIPPIIRNGMSQLAASPELGGPSKPMKSADSRGGTGVEPGNTSFTAPISDLFIEVFGLDQSSWLRRVVIGFLQQISGGTLERKVRDTLRGVTEPDTLAKLLEAFSDTLFPDGERRPQIKDRSEREKLATQHKASKTLLSLIPDILVTAVGGGNARRAARRISGVLQDKRLNQHLILQIMDEVVSAVFPPSPTPTKM